VGSAENLLVLSVGHAPNDTWGSVYIGICALSATFASLDMHCAMRKYGGSGGVAPALLKSAIDGAEWSAVALHLKDPSPLTLTA
jgi:hypothetical protein